MAKAVSNTSRTKTTSTTKTTKAGRTERASLTSSTSSRTVANTKALRSPAPAKKAALKPKESKPSAVVLKTKKAAVAKKTSAIAVPKVKQAAPVKKAGTVAVKPKQTAAVKNAGTLVVKASKAAPAKKAAVGKAVPAKPLVAKAAQEKKPSVKPVPAKAVVAAKKSAAPPKSAPKAAAKAAPLPAPAPPPAKSVTPLIKVASILITQPRPDTEKSPYFDLAKRFNLKLTFHPFVKIEGVTSREFRRQRVAIAEHTAVVLTSRNAVDHFFRIADETKTKVSQDMKYFCSTEAVALYLQKFILYRKRKVFFSADGSTKGLQDVITKHKQEKYMVVVTDGGKNEISQHLAKLGSTYSEVTLYRTVPNDIAPAMQDHFDMIVFFSPFSVHTLFAHDPKFKQNGMLIGAFGPTTSLAVENAGLRLDVKAPAPATPSMVAALEQYLAVANKRK